ncbi:MAG: MBG domain-containing protein, partial [Oscillospiraceae bacterium]
MKIRKIMSAAIAAEILIQMVPSASVIAFADTPAFDIIVNGQSAAGAVSVAYGEELSFRLNGAAEGDDVHFSYATETDAAAGIWHDIDDCVCRLEPGKYLLKYDVTTSDDSYYSSEDGGIVYSIQIEKAKLAAPSSLVWNGCNMGWGVVTSSSTGATADEGAVKGYTLNIYKNGSLVGTEYTETAAYVAAFADKVLNDVAYGSGKYTFTVTAEVSDSAAAHYTSSDVSSESPEYIVPLVTVSGGSGISSVSPSESFLLLPGSSYSSKEISASAAATYEFARWSGTGVAFADSTAESTTVTIDEDYSGAETLTITALSKDNEPPEILSLTTEGGYIKATAQDNEGVTEYAFSTAGNAEAVTSWIAADNTSDTVQSFSFEPTAGGRYYFYAKDASGNTSVSAAYIDVTMITYHDYSDGGNVFDKTTYFFGDSFTVPDITRGAWVFGGWHRLADLSDEAVSTVDCDMENGIELYAEWSEQTLDIPALTPISKTYDSQEETLSVTLTNTGVLTYQWYKNGAAIEGATDSSLTVKNVTDSGSYHVYVELKQADGTVIGSGCSEEVTVDIRRAPLTVKADDDEITYGSEAPGSYSVTFSGFVGTEGEEVVTGGTVTCNYEKGDNAGGYDIVPAGFSAANYEIDHRNGTLTVKEKTGTLTAKLAEPDVEYYYAPGTAHTPAVIVKDGDTLLTENRDYELEYTDNINAGTAAITVTYKGNYSGV